MLQFFLNLNIGLVSYLMLINTIYTKIKNLKITIIWQCLIMALAETK